MVLEGCANPNLGCCILLRGASLQELVRVKRVVKFMLLACYNWKHEQTFLNDIEAILPEPGMTFDDDVDDNNETFNDDDATIKIDNDNETNDDEPVNDNDVTAEVDKETNEKVDDKPNEVDVSKEFDDNNCEVTVLSNEQLLSNNKIDIPNPNIEERHKNIEITSTENNCDPLQNTNAKLIRKADTDKTLSCGVVIRDFSDPLRARQSSLEDEVFFPKQETKLKEDSVSER